MSESRSIEASGPDIESAITKGVTELGVSREDVIVEVLEEPGRRLLGLGAKQAKVRVTVIKAPATPRTTRPEQAAPAPTAEAVEKTEKPTAPARRAEPAERADRTERPQRTERPARTERTERPQRAERPDYDVDDEWASGEEAVSDEDLAADATVGAETLREILTHMDIDAKVISRRAESTSDEPQHWTLEIQGRNLGALIGRRGETLAALQYITRLIASRDLERRANIVIDVEGYKSRRETMLRRLAKRMAEQAVQRGRTVSLEPMPPHERRIIHLALRDNPNVTTESVGEGDHRKVTIIPRRSQ
jgi:spoIIIJ-associated protein